MDLLAKLTRPVLFNLPYLFSSSSSTRPLVRAFGAISFNPIQSPINTRPLLAVQPALYVPSCGFKVVGKVKRRCKECYMIVRHERLYNLCKAKPRHKQMSMKAKEDKSWILTHATQGPKRAW